MPTFVYTCAAGHATDRFFAAAERRTKSTRCGACPRRARFSIVATFAGVGVKIIPAHFNISFGHEVRGPRHLRQLQKQHNCVDWEPCKDSPGSQLSLERLRKEHRA